MHQQKICIDFDKKKTNGKSNPTRSYDRHPYMDSHKKEFGEKFLRDQHAYETTVQKLREKRNTNIQLFSLKICIEASTKKSHMNILLRTQKIRTKNMTDMKVRKKESFYKT